MVRGLLIGISVFVSSVSLAQNVDAKMIMYEPEGYVKPGTLGASATFSPSWMLNRPSANYYLSGYAEYHLDHRLSFRSDNYFMISSADEDPFLDQAFRSYLGAFYHFRKHPWSNWDKYIGFQPGIAYMARNPYQGGIQPLVAIESEYSLSPSFAITAGTSFYVWKYFNFFANLTYVNSKLIGVSGAPAKTDELILSAGLGFQIQTRKQ